MTADADTQAQQLDGVFEEVTATFPASPKYLRTARLLATAMASAAGFDVEALEDIRIVVDELLSAALEVARGPLEIVIGTRPGECRYSGSVPCDSPPLPFDPLRSVIVTSLSDAHHFALAEGRLSFGFTKLVESRA